MPKRRRIRHARLRAKVYQQRSERKSWREIIGEEIKKADTQNGYLPVKI